ncbi:MaoC family dehydratase [Janthinobacterium agaricidamnosum]|uniref:MaoC like domain protein n=1 Tax=Janthinobacterium agaricidamnosum NBRC 102515 = DSM 9628 TaxID=1349767 RepID=W0V512_9BURK|nr:MaoC family dehydratase [Janthinobacterium agaricidamnosum]CDG82700.1 maoC like domain protein [Janthinobacterium agaricidamnosum NBRC 102515 = DSM 9628]
MTSKRDWYFEDFFVGQEIELGQRHVTEDEIIAFATQFDPQPFHVDHEAAEQSIFKGVIASGWHTCSMMMRLVVDNLLSQSSSMGSPGLDSVRWIKPVRAGDTLKVVYVTKDVRPSASKPDRGVVVSIWRASNQHGEVVATVEGMGMFGRRHVDGAAPHA